MDTDKMLRLLLDFLGPAAAFATPNQAKLLAVAAIALLALLQLPPTQRNRVVTKVAIRAAISATFPAKGVIIDPVLANDVLQLLRKKALDENDRLSREVRRKFATMA